MVSTTSQQPLSLDHDSCEINPDALIALLEEGLSSHEAHLQDESPKAKTRSKRKGHPMPGRTGQNKRIKGPSSDEHGGKIDEMDEWNVLRHAFEFQCTRQDIPEFLDHVGDPHQPTDDNWGVVRRLIDFMNANCRRLEEAVTVDLGCVEFRRQSGEVRVVTIDNGDWCLRLPPLHDTSDDEVYGFHSAETANLLSASYDMSLDGRVKLSGSLCVAFLPSSLVDSGRAELPFRFILEVEVGIVTPKIFEPFSRTGSITSRNHIALLEEAQRRLLSHVFPNESVSSHQRDEDVDIPFFFSSLRPALAFDSHFAYEAAQPDTLRSTLLPFQRRSVGWLLNREGKHINESGQIITEIDSTDATSLFWEKVSMSGMKCYFNRLTGSLSLNPPQSDKFLGGILAEEPGMGKTLECISLMLLNPGNDRHPRNQRWDPESRVDVREIKTTLIVTPASLAQQWVDEMALHAPELKVLVYDGWHKVPVPITLADAKAQVSTKGKKRGRASATTKIATQRSRVRRSGGFKTTSEASEAGPSNVNPAEGSDDDAANNGGQPEDGKANGGDEAKDWASYVNQFDVCITTYNILQHDLGVARAPVDRPRREVGKYSETSRPRSPLILCEWYRVIMDEVQMVGGGKTQEMVSLIPRLSSLAVSGTPARASVADLIHVLKFLRVESLTNMPRLWYRLLKPAFATQFATLFGQIAIRTLKSSVKDELTIPEQRRYVVPIHLGRVERHVYDQNLEQALVELGLDARGVAASDGWQVDVGVLRNWLRRLRGICIHPQVGQLQKQSDKYQKRGGLKTIGEVLEGMKDQNWRDLMDGQKSKILAIIKQARLLQHNRTNENRYSNARELLIIAQKQALGLCQEIRDEIAEHDRKGEILKQEAANRNKPRSEEHSTVTKADAKGKGKEKDADDISDDDSDDGLPKTPAGYEHAHKKNALQSRLREALIVVHQVHFLLGDVYHMLGESCSGSEDTEYAAAENIRKELLKTTEVAANKSMMQLKESADKKALTEEDLHIPYCGKGAIKSEELLREADEIIDVLNEQSDLLWKWRARISGLLSASLSAGGDGDEVDGQEYARTLDTQGEAETYLQAYAALMADRKEVMNAERTTLAVANAKETKRRKTHAASRAIANNEEVALLEASELQPEHEALQGELTNMRKEILTGYKGRAIKSVMVDLGGVAAGIVSENDPEKIIAKDWAKRLRRLLSNQTLLLEKLESDLAQFRKAFNDRILYFRQLQELSDSVADPTWDGTIQNALEEAKEAEKKLEIEINKNRARQRYLSHMTQAQAEEDDEDEGVCILCRCEFTRGFITHCAHVYCEGCMKAWLARSQGKVCPVCRVIIDVDQLQRVTMTENKRIEQLEAPPNPNTEPVPKTRRVIRYNTINPNLFDEIENTESHGSYGSKIQTLVRHLLYLQEKEPSAKSIVFSAWADSLHIIQHALTANGIPSIKIDQSGGQKSAANRFRNDPSILVLLLHGERENAGLNVTCASRVFLVESVVQHAFEVQAIARIDRMGQTRPTEVYCYYAEDTVERNILDLAAKQGLSLYTEENASGSVDVTSLTVDGKKAQIDSPKKTKQKGDFIFRADDMLAILFPHMFEDVEYLLPDANDDMHIDSQDAMVIDSAPVAGPSRIRR